MSDNLRYILYGVIYLSVLYCCYATRFWSLFFLIVFFTLIISYSHCTFDTKLVIWVFSVGFIIVVIYCIIDELFIPVLELTTFWALNDLFSQDISVKILIPILCLYYAAFYDENRPLEPSKLYRPISEAEFFFFFLLLSCLLLIF